MFRVFIYRRTYNLGDAIQTVALARLLGGRCKGVYRDEPLPAEGAALPLVANGWLGAAPPPKGEALFAGVHVGKRHNEFRKWISGSAAPVGVRDPFTAALLRGVAPVEMTGCATLTFERYTGARSGKYCVDAAARRGTVPLTHSIDGDETWTSQWQMALEQLERIWRAEIVYTSRLHVVLPCLAFGTPVVFPSRELPKVLWRERLSLLQEIPFQYDEAITADVSDLASRYTAHLARLTGPLQPTETPVLPEPLSA